MNKIAYIDLTTQTVTEENIPDEWRRLFLGGRGINMLLLHNLSRPHQDPFDPKAPLIFGTGLLTGVAAIGTARYNVTAHSPYSGFIGDSNAGGFFGPELRYAGYDHLFITGKASSPTMLWIQDNRIEFLDASFMENLTLPETLNTIRTKLGEPDAQIAAIGPAGRKLVRFACIMNSINDANGHTGMGTVMGSKNLWAIAVRGTQDLPVANPTLLMKTLEKQYHQVTSRKGFKASAYYGTVMRFNLMRTELTLDCLGDQTNFYEMGDEMDTDVFMDRYQYAVAACFNCPMHTKHVHIIRGGPDQGLQGGGPEFADAGGFGSNIGARSWDTVLACSNICNDYGLDKLTSGKLLAAAMHLYQDGLVTEKTTGGIHMDWGDHMAATTFLRQLGSREGFGGIFSDGWNEACQRLFSDNAAKYEQYCAHVKGEPAEVITTYKRFATHALGAATATRGSCHLRSRFTMEELGVPAEFMAKIIGRPIDPDPTVTEGKAWPVMWAESLCAVGDALGMCRFLSKWMTPGFLGFEEWAEAIYSATGLNLTVPQVMEVGERIWNVERLFLIREGLSRKADWLPDQVFDTPIKAGPFKGSVQNRESFTRLLDEYYQEHGWDEQGIPTRDTIKRLELDKMLKLDRQMQKRIIQSGGEK